MLLKNCLDGLELFTTFTDAEDLPGIELKKLSANSRRERLPGGQRVNDLKAFDNSLFDSTKSGAAFIKNMCLSMRLGSIKESMCYGRKELINISNQLVCTFTSNPFTNIQRPTLLVSDALLSLQKLAATLALIKHLSYCNGIDGHRAFYRCNHEMEIIPLIISNHFCLIKWYKKVSCAFVENTCYMTRNVVIKLIEALFILIFPIITFSRL